MEARVRVGGGLWLEAGVRGSVRFGRGQARAQAQVGGEGAEHAVART